MWWRIHRADAVWHKPLWRPHSTHRRQHHKGSLSSYAGCGVIVCSLTLQHVPAFIPFQWNPWVSSYFVDDIETSQCLLWCEPCSRPGAAKQIKSASSHKKGNFARRPYRGAASIHQRHSLRVRAPWAPGASVLHLRAVRCLHPPPV